MPTLGYAPAARRQRCGATDGDATSSPPRDSRNSSAVARGGWSSSAPAARWRPFPRGRSSATTCSACATCDPWPRSSPKVDRNRAGRRCRACSTPPHEVRAVDVTDYSQVLEATRGMDAVINMTVMRHDPVEAFRVNTLGAYNVIRAAVECGIRGVVQTGPQQVTNTMPGGYWSDIDLPSNVPPRPGVALYFISKFLGQEIVRDLRPGARPGGRRRCCSGHSRTPTTARPDELGCYPFLVSWADAAEAVRGALARAGIPPPVRDLPHRGRPTARHDITPTAPRSSCTGSRATAWTSTGAANRNNSLLVGARRGDQHWRTRYTSGWNFFRFSIFGKSLMTMYG